MSFSFSVRAATLALALAAAAAKFDEVVATQPEHAKDRDAALGALAGMSKVVVIDDEKDVTISLNGSLSWDGSDPDKKPIGVGFGGYIGQMVRTPAV